jgi:glyoxylase-like metal-dependent hydrolase (beta-lactamase superfamily II)
MSVHRILPGLHELRLPGVNAFLLESESQGLTLVDTGLPGSAAAIIDAVHSLGGEASDLRRILVTHSHADHTGSLADLKRLTSAQIFMHRRDAALVAKGRAKRPLFPSPGILNSFLFKRMVGPKPTTISRVEADVLVENREEIPVWGGISVIHTPGHTEGHVAFLARERGVLFVGDAAANFFDLRLMPGYEHLQQGMMSLGHLCRYRFEVACFGHGPSIPYGADRRFRSCWDTLPSPRRGRSAFHRLGR